MSQQFGELELYGKNLAKASLLVVCRNLRSRHKITFINGNAARAPMPKPSNACHLLGKFTFDCSPAKNGAFSVCSVMFNDGVLTPAHLGLTCVDHGVCACCLVQLAHDDACSFSFLFCDFDLAHRHHPYSHPPLWFHVHRQTLPSLVCSAGNGARACDQTGDSRLHFPLEEHAAHHLLAVFCPEAPCPPCKSRRQLLLARTCWTRCPVILSRV